MKFPDLLGRLNKHAGEHFADVCSLTSTILLGLTALVVWGSR